VKQRAVDISRILFIAAAAAAAAAAVGERYRCTCPFETPIAFIVACIRWKQSPKADSCRRPGRPALAGRVRACTGVKGLRSIASVKGKRCSIGWSVLRENYAAADYATYGDARSLVLSFYERRSPYFPKNSGVSVPRRSLSLSRLPRDSFPPSSILQEDGTPTSRLAR
jgi:hypothetical protein